MASISYPEIPERVSSLMPDARQEDLRIYKARTVSAASRVSNLSLDTQGTTVSDFLEAKIEELEAEKDYIRCIKNGLLEAHDRGALSHADLQEQIGQVVSQYQQQADIVRVLKRDKRNLTEDLAEKAATEKSTGAKKLRQNDPEDQGLLQRAYRDSIIPRVMSACARQSRGTFPHKNFKRTIVTYYGIKEPHVQRGYSWCHILGWPIRNNLVKAAHIVPKSLTGDEIAHLFGSTDDVARDPRNSLSLYDEIEPLLDTGVIAVVPELGEGSESAWKCVVLDESRKEDLVIARPEQNDIHVKDLDCRRLTFLNANRPRRRYLYFRYIISYLNHKRFNTVTAIQKMESRRFWPSGGEYLQRTTMVTLARCISGCEIPEGLIQGKSFDGDPKPTADEQEHAISASSRLRREAETTRAATMASIAAAGAEGSTIHRRQGE